MNELALFAGAGGGILGGKLLGWRTVCAVERDAYAASVLAQRQNDGILEPFPIWSDVCTFDGKPWLGIIDVVSGGFPCQDISAAGKGAGIDGERSGLWSHMARIIDEVRPQYVFVENSPLLVSRGLSRVLGDLAEMGFDAKWGIVGAHHVGAPHKRDRCWIVAHATSIDCDSRWTEPARQQRTARIANGGDDMADTESQRRGKTRKLRHNQSTERPAGGCETQNPAHTNRINDDPSGYGTGQISQLETPDISTRKTAGDANSERLEKRKSIAGNHAAQQQAAVGTDWWTTEPDLGRVAYGVAARVDRLKAIGNGQVPMAAATAWRLLKP